MRKKEKTWIALLKDRNAAFEMMCTKDNSILDSLNKYLGYANNKIIESVKKLIEKYGKNSKEYFENFHNELGSLLNIKDDKEAK